LAIGVVELANMKIDNTALVLPAVKLSRIGLRLSLLRLNGCILKKNASKICGCNQSQLGLREEEFLTGILEFKESFQIDLVEEKFTLSIQNSLIRGRLAGILHVIHRLGNLLIQESELMNLFASFKVASRTNVVRDHGEFGKEEVLSIDSLDPKSLPVGGGKTKEQVTKDTDGDGHGFGFADPDFHFRILVEFGITVIILNDTVNLLSTHTTFTLSFTSFGVLETGSQLGNTRTRSLTDHPIEIIVRATTMDTHATKNHLDKLLVHVGGSKKDVLEVDITPMSRTAGMVKVAGVAGGGFRGTHLGVH
jgi:hypothetical protein